MTFDPDVLPVLRDNGFTVSEQIPLSTLGSFQLGGPARAVISCSSTDELTRLRPLLTDLQVSALLIGEGTNLLFSDAGWDGLLLRCAGHGADPQPVTPSSWRVSAAMSLEMLVDWAIRNSLSGLEPFVGIPGTVGGAVVGNAGAWGVQFADRLRTVSGWSPSGDPFHFPLEDCGFHYRDSRLKQEGFWVSEVEIELTQGDPQKLRSEQERILRERAARHPEWRNTPCIGSFFKNLAPTSAAGRRQAAGWFLEQAGAKNCRVGGAAVFSKHANILIKAEENCRASDVAGLAEKLKKEVKKKHGIDLEREVRYLGDFPGEPSHPGFW